MHASLGGRPEAEDGLGRNGRFRHGVLHGWCPRDGVAWRHCVSTWASPDQSDFSNDRQRRELPQQTSVRRDWRPRACAPEAHDEREES
jgi:hypothetical protein